MRIAHWCADFSDESMVEWFITDPSGWCPGGPPGE
jgi:hypothetical protein